MLLNTQTFTVSPRAGVAVGLGALQGSLGWSQVGAWCPESLLMLCETWENQEGARANVFPLSCSAEPNDVTARSPALYWQEEPSDSSNCKFLS